MECQVCNLRSSEGFCHVCQLLICPDCGRTCYRCGKMTCMDHGSTSKSGKWVCEVCRGGHRARRAAARGAAAPDLSHAPVAATAVPAGAEPDEDGLVFEDVAAPVGRLEVEPWKAGTWIGVIAITVTAVFALIWRGVPWPFLLVAGLGTVWAGIGIVGRYADKGLAAMGLGLNIVPFVIAAVVGVTGTDMQKRQVETDPFESMTPQQRLQSRQLKQREFMEQLQLRRSRMQPPGLPPPPPEARQQEE